MTKVTLHAVIFLNPVSSREDVPGCRCPSSGKCRNALAIALLASTANVCRFSLLLTLECESVAGLLGVSE